MEDYETAIDYNLQALEIYREFDDLSGITYTLLEIGSTYIFMEKYKEAAPYLEEAMEKVPEVRSLQLLSGANQYMYRYHLATKNYEKALKFHERYKLIEDSIYTEYSSQQIADMRTLYETEMKEAEITSLMQEKTIHELQIKKSKNLRTFFIIALLLYQ